MAKENGTSSFQPKPPDFFLDPLEGERKYPKEPISEYIYQFPFGRNFRLAKGRTEMTPNSPLIVGHRYDFSWTYYPEEQNLAAGAMVAFAIPRTWSQPQTENSAGPGYVTAETSNKGKVEISLSNASNIEWWIKVYLKNQSIPKDGWVRVYYKAATIQRFPQREFINLRNAMRTVIDCNSDGQYTCVAAKKTQKPVIQAAPPSRFHVASAAIVKAGEEIDVRVSTLDFCDNPSYPPPIGEIFAALPEDPYRPIASTILDTKDNGHAILKVTVPTDVETFQVIVSNRKDNLRGVSPLMVVGDTASKMKVYFGDIHCHTAISDGLNTPADSYTHARDKALLDFCCVIDHRDSPEISKIEGPFIPAMTEEIYDITQKATEIFNEPGRFVTFQGYEQCYIEEYPGHRNIYFRGICKGLFQGKTLEQLYEYLEGYQALVVSHHSVIWETRPHLNNTRYERLAEIYSMHCSNEYKGSPINNFITTNNKAETGISTRGMLSSGHRVGFIGSGDNHQGMPGIGGRPGRFTNIVYSVGLAAVFAPELTREAIFDSLYARHCYGTTGARIYLDFQVDGEPMGSEIKAKKDVVLPYDITVTGTDKIAKVEIVQDNEERCIYNYDGRQFVKLTGELQIKKGTWLYVRVTQIDRHIAWSSPIWIDIEE